ncbi:MAG: cupredoxin domain-containing protein [Chloroflexaceae bacterium]|nr:cupredoxin domain-containing protein [Chloroflexaceae bacterium]
MGKHLFPTCVLILYLLGLVACGTVPRERQLELTVTAAGYDRPRLEAQVGEQVFIRFRNADAIAHNLTIALPSGQRTVSADAGVDAILAFPARQAGTFRMFCTVPGHTEQGELVILP